VDVFLKHGVVDCLTNGGWFIICKQVIIWMCLQRLKRLMAYFSTCQSMHSCCRIGNLQVHYYEISVAGMQRQVWGSMSKDSSTNQRHASHALCSERWCMKLYSVHVLIIFRSATGKIINRESAEAAVCASDTGTAAVLAAVRANPSHVHSATTAWTVMSDLRDRDCVYIASKNRQPDLHAYALAPTNRSDVVVRRRALSPQNRAVFDCR